MANSLDPNAEWLEADGLGGFASGTVGGLRTRRYHALLLAATQPPTGRVVLVNGFDAWVGTPRGRYAIASQRYTPDVINPLNGRRIEDFDGDPWPRWTIRLGDGTRVEQEIFAVKGSPVVALAWRLTGRETGVTLTVRPFLSGRDYHALHHENPDFRFDPDVRNGRLTWQPYASLPTIVALANGDYAHEPLWYRNFLYTEERERGLDCIEDLAAPGTFRFDLSRGEAVLLFGADTDPAGSPLVGAEERLSALRASERQRRRSFPSRLHRAADAYLVARGEGQTIVTGYPWFTDWGRDTFIAIRGLCLATGRLDDARRILSEWAGAVSQGMLPNRFPDRGDVPEFNAVDASLWYVIAVHEFLEAAQARGLPIPTEDRARLQTAVSAILAGYASGTRHGIRLDTDGLLAAGEPGVQLTWMDAKVGEWVVTPRIGKPVEIQALWLNALRIAADQSHVWRDILARGLESFRARFWNEARGSLHDVVDVDHRSGTADGTLRPNQILAVGGLPFSLLEGEQAQRVVQAVEDALWTPLGLRSLAADEPGYAARYEGDGRQRDGSYHQGTVWPWLIGPFVEAWVRIRGGSAEAKREARSRFLAPLLRHLDEAGIGHVSEIADATAPHTPRGCPFQAWSVGEVLRLDLVVLAEARTPVQPTARVSA
jgi:predicted glycogen debranching enzyme